MEVKKSPKADLERKRFFFIEIGLTLALAATFLAFEWPTTNQEKIDLNTGDETIEEFDMIPITTHAQTPPPPPPPAQILDVIEIVDNTTELPDEIDIAPTDVTEDYKIDLKYKEPEEDHEPITFVVVEQMPEFPGGNKALIRYLSNAIKYPESSLDNGIQGKVYLKFIINEQGIPEQITILRGVNKALDAEAVRVIKEMPQWTPGKQRNKAVKVWYTLPINFAIR